MACDATAVFATIGSRLRTVATGHRRSPRTALPPLENPTVGPRNQGLSPAAARGHTRSSLYPPLRNGRDRLQHKKLATTAATGHRGREGDRLA